MVVGTGRTVAGKLVEERQLEEAVVGRSRMLPSWWVIRKLCSQHVVNRCLREKCYLSQRREDRKSFSKMTSGKIQKRSADKVMLMEN